LSSYALATAQFNDPNAELRQAGSFHGIKVSNAFDVYLSQSKKETVAVSASELKFRERIRTEVRDGILHVWYDNEGKFNTGNKKLKAYISFRDINQLKVSGACDVVITDGLKAESLEVDLSGASDLKGKLSVRNLSVNLSGASDMQVSGDVVRLKVDASGASNFKAFGLVSEVCDAEASGASDIKVTVTKELSAQASGASDVHYRGNGMIREVKTSGASSVSKSKS